MKSFIANSFSGGMNNWVHPGLLEKNVAVQLVDADVTNGKLLPQKLPLQSFTTVDALSYYGGIDRSVVKWYDRSYWSLNNAWEPPYYGGDEENIGVMYPSSHPSPELVAVEDGSGLTGKYKYCWCYVNVNGWESAPCAEDGPLWVDVTADNQHIKITAPEVFPEDIDYIKIYRTAANGADFYCVGELHIPGGHFLDKVDDNTLVMLEAAESFNNYPPPSGGKYLTESGGVFFLAVGSRVYFSALGNPHAWPTLNFVGFDDTVTGITTEFQGVLVFTRNNAYRITGADDAATLVKSVLPGNQGCRNYNTIAHLSNAPIWLSNDGICLWDGESISVISYNIINTRKIEARFAVAANDIYYMFAVDRVVVFDRRNGAVFRELSIGNYDFSYGWYDGNTDQIFLLKNETLYEFGNGGNGELIYLSPYIGDTELAVHKFVEFIIHCSAPALVYFFVDGKEIFFKTIKNIGRTRIKLPFGTIGKHLQLKMITKGELSEYAVFYE